MRSLLWPRENKLVKQTLLVIAGSLFLALASQVVIPMVPVPITLQTFAVMIIAMLYGWRLGAATIALYLLEGLCGMPVFAEWSFGLQTLLGTNGGYLFGFLPAVLLTGYLLEKGFAKNFLGAFVAGLLGDAMILLCGMLVLSLFIGINQAFLLGVVPFIAAEVVKLAVLGVVVPRCWKRESR
jgi:biotin transport system substrate-specific component